MRYISVFAALSVLLLIVFPAHAGEEITDEDKEVVGLFGTLLAPSIFTTASSERLVGVSLYGRMLTGEGEVPDFKGGVEDSIDQLEFFASGRMAGFGLTLGLGTGSDFELEGVVFQIRMCVRTKDGCRIGILCAKRIDGEGDVFVRNPGIQNDDESITF